VVFGNKEKVKNNMFSGIFLHVYILSAAAMYGGQVIRGELEKKQ